MKIRRFLSLFLSIVMLIGLVPVFAEEANSVTAYVSVTKYGEVLNDKSGIPMAYVPVELSGKESYNLDDVFTELHNLYYEGGSEVGYASANGDLGLSVTKFWEDTSGKFGYYLNGGTEYVSGLSHEVENGDYIDAIIYQNYYPDTEDYAKFEKTNIDVIEGEPFDITLYVSGYDENGNMVFSPCENAIITVNGEETEYTTDENGKASITLDTAGTQIISAKKSKLSGEEEVPAITAPVCVASVSQPPAVALIHNIAKKYVESDLTQASTNLPWIVADLMAYEKLYPNSENKLTDMQKQAYLDKLISDVKDTTSPGDMAKTIIALRSMGYDPQNVYTSSLEKIDVVGRLTELVKNQDAAIVNNEYTLPYVMVALEESENYITEEQRGYLINTALSLSGRWQSVGWGTDALTPMLLALAPYYDKNTDVKSKVDNAVNILKGEQSDDGMIKALWGGESASTGLAICGLSALGINADQVKKTENSLIDGILTDVNDTNDGFSNGFATEQGFRGLLAWRFITEGDGRDMYDFSDYPKDEAYATWASGCPVTFEVTPSDATVSVDGAEAVLGNMYDLEEGIYTYSVSKSGYVTKTGEITVTSVDKENHIPKKVAVSLSKSSSSDGSGSADKTIRIGVKVMTHNGDKCNGSYTYKNNSSRYNALVGETITAEKGVSVFDVLDEALAKNKIEYKESSKGYISSIDGIAEFDHGRNSGWMFEVNGKHITTDCRNTKLNSSSSVVWFYTDDYTKENGSQNFGSSSGGGSAVKQESITIDEANGNIKPKVTADKNGVASVELNAETISSAVNKATKDKTISAVDITPEINGDATKISITIPKTAVENIANNNLGLAISSDIAKVTLSNKGVKNLDGKLCITAENKDDSVYIEVTVDGNVQNKIDGGVDITIPNNSQSKNAVLVIVGEDGSETAVKKAVLTKDGIKAIIKGSAIVKTADRVKAYPDTEKHWAENAIDFVASRGIFSGTENGFEPDANTSRAMLVTTLFRLEEAEAIGTQRFEDVSDDTWYTDAVVWASANKIAKGTGKGFEPDGNVTREQLCTIIYRYAENIGMDTDTENGFDNFKDKEEVSDWAKEAIGWAVNSGIVSGKPDGLLDPQGYATRAEVAVIYQRLIGLMIK